MKDRHRGPRTRATIVPILLGIGLLSSVCLPVRFAVGGEADDAHRGLIAPAAAAVVPGVVLHGTGHFVMGERQTARRILALEGVGLAGVILGVGGIAGTGASRYLIYPLAQVTVFGAGLFLASWMADLYGVLAPSGGTGRPPPEPVITAAAGGRYVHNPAADYRYFAVQEVAFQRPRWSAAVEAWIAVDAPVQRLRAPVQLVLWRGRPGNVVGASLAAIYHRNGSAGYSTSMAELSVGGRVGLEWLGPTLQGAFLDWGAGAAVGMAQYRGDGSELEELLLSRLGFGTYLGHAADRGGEVEIYYDHRHDGFAGGLKMPGLGSGPAGHFGARLQVYLSRRWGGALEVQAGAAYVAGFSLLFRHGAVP